MWVFACAVRTPVVIRARTPKELFAFEQRSPGRSVKEKREESRQDKSYTSASMRGAKMASLCPWLPKEVDTWKISGKTLTRMNLLFLRAKSLHTGRSGLRLHGSSLWTDFYSRNIQSFILSLLFFFPGANLPSHNNYLYSDSSKMSLGLIAAELEFGLPRVSITEFLNLGRQQDCTSICFPSYTMGSSKKDGEKASRLGENDGYLENM